MKISDLWKLSWKATWTTTHERRLQVRISDFRSSGKEILCIATGGNNILLLLCYCRPWRGNQNGSRVTEHPRLTPRRFTTRSTASHALPLCILTYWTNPLVNFDQPNALFAYFELSQEQYYSGVVRAQPPNGEVKQICDTQNSTVIIVSGLNFPCECTRSTQDVTTSKLYAHFPGKLVRTVLAWI